MDLNHAGDVVELTGTNGDGVLLLEGYDYTGKDRLTVADELVDRAIDMGFWRIGGTVNFSIDTPEESLFQEYGMELRDEVTHHLEGRVAVVCGVDRLHGAAVRAKELRGGASLVLAGLQAEGETAVTGVEHIQRGYEDLTGELAQLGADIRQEER